MSIPLADALKIAEETLRVARVDGAAPLAVVVLDTGGHPIVSLREDNTGFLRGEIAKAKAWGALGMGQPSRQLADRASNQLEFFMSLVQISQGRLALAPGGVLCLDAAGAVVGAIGVSGDAAEVDEKCAVSAVESVGYRAVT